ncbi:MAG TPA: hypothetical protein VF337_03435 [Candidatus Limnocylindrales bacterium]
MNLEQDLSEALHGAFDPARPSPDLRVRIVAATRPESSISRRAPRRLLMAASGLAAALVVVALVGNSVRPPVAAPQTPSPAPTNSMTHYAVGRLSFDYPNMWKSRVNVLPWVLALWTGSDPADCLTPTPEPTGPGSHCGRQTPLVPGTLYVTVGDYATQPTEPLIDPTQASALPPGGRYVTVGGQPAVLITQTTGTEETLDWTIAQPKEPHTRVQVHAEIAAPGSDKMKAEVDALVASFRFSSPVKPLDLSQANAIAGQWITMASSTAGFGCFTASPGVRTTGVLTEYMWGLDGLPRPHALSKPLPVSCLMTIEAVPSIGLWKLTFTQSWSADADRTAGSSTLVFWLDPDASDLDGWSNGVGGAPDVLGDPIPYSN